MRKRGLVPYKLTPKAELIKPNSGELKAILRAADEIIFSAGRGMLAKILKGSKDKKVLEHNLDRCPVYGAFRTRTITEITKMVDWAIIHGYLAIDYDWRLPLIVFSPKGWEMYKPIYAAELHQRILEAVSEEKTVALIEDLKQTNREVVLILLEQLATDENVFVIPFLRKWHEVEVKKVRKRINQTISQLKA